MKRFRNAITIGLIFVYTFFNVFAGVVKAAATDVPTFQSAFPANSATYTFIWGGANDVDFDASGNAYVAGRTMSQIFKLDSTGAVVTHWGSNGTGNGQFTALYGIAVDKTNGFVYVTDASAARINKFDTSGNFLTRWGSGGTGNGQFGSQSPNYINVDSSGNVYVADTGNHRIQKFDSNGTFLLKFGAVGVGNGQFNTSNSPQGVVVDTSGNIFVADYGNNRIQKFDSTGVYVSQFGTLGSGNGQLNHPTSVTLDSSGNIWVSDQNNNRIQEFTSGGVYVTQLAGAASSTTPGTVTAPWEARVDSSGNLWVVQNTPALDKYNSSFTYLHEWSGKSSTTNAFSVPDMFTVDASGNFYIADQSNNRIIELSPTGAFIRSFGSFGSGNGQLSTPGGIAVGPISGNIIVSDSNNARIEIFTPTGTYVSQFNGSLGAGGAFSFPQGIDVDSSENIYVSDTCNVQKFDSSGTYITKFGTCGTGNGQFNFADSVRVHGGNVWVTDGTNNTVQKFTTSGTFVSKFGSTGTGNGQFTYAFDIGFDSNGYIYVTDDNFASNRIQKFDSTGAYLATWGCCGTISGDNGTFIHTAGLYIDASDNIYVSDDVRIQKFAYAAATAAPAATGTPTVTNTGTTTSGCNAAPPPSAPNLFSGTRKGTSATLSFTPVNTSTTGYNIMYGVTPSDNQYGVTFSQGYSPGVINYTINKLNASKSYTFKVRAVNNCVGGPWSSDLTVNAAGATPTPTPVLTPTPTPTPAPLTLTFVNSAGLPIVGATVKITPGKLSPKPLATLTPTATPKKTPTPKPTKTPKPTATPKPTRTPTPKPSATPTKSPVATPTSTVKPTASPTVAPTPTASPTPVQTLAPTPTPVVTPTASPTVSPSIVASATPVLSPTPTPTILGTTDGTGSVQVNLPPGNYTATVTSGGNSYQANVNVSSTDTHITVQVSSFRTTAPQSIITPQNASKVTRAGAVAAGSVAGAVLMTNILATIVAVSRSLFTIYSTTGRSVFNFPLDLMTGSSQWLVSLFWIFGKKKGSKKAAVFNSLSNDGVGGAYIIFYSETGNLKSDFTDREGHYEVRPVPDNYKIKVNHATYNFPSKVVMVSSTGEYPHIYLPGEVIKVVQKGTVVSDVSVPVDPATVKSAGKYAVAKMNSYFSFAVSKFGNALAIAGILVSGYAAVFDPSLVNGTVLAVVVALFAGPKVIKQVVKPQKLQEA